MPELHQFRERVWCIVPLRVMAVLCTAEAQLLIVIYRKRPGEGHGWGSCTDAQGSCFQLTTGGRHGRNLLRAQRGGFWATIEGPTIFN